MARSRRSAGDHLRRASICGFALLAAGLTARAGDMIEPRHSAELDRMIIEQAKRNGVPEKLVRRIVMRESKYDPRARNHLYWGLMQISYPTAKSMGFRGTPDELLNPLVNLTYAVPYLANAFIIAGKREDEAVRLYAAGYYYTARQRGLLGLLRTAESRSLSGEPAQEAPETVVASAEPAPQSVGVYGSLPQAQPAAAPSVAAVDSTAPVGASGHVAATMASDGVSMVADKHGDLEPPKKWRHDGGITQVAQGEQGLENVAAYAGAKDEASTRHASHHAKKATEFASIDMPSGAQAYASAGGQDPRFAQAPSQAAIAQATAAQPAELAPQQAAFAAQPGPGEPPPAQPEAGQAFQTAAAAADAPAKAPRHVAHRHHRDSGETEVAKADGPAPDDGAPKAHKHAHHAKSPADAQAADTKSADPAVVAHADDGPQS